MNFEIIEARFKEVPVTKQITIMMCKLRQKKICGIWKRSNLSNQVFL